MSVKLGNLDINKMHLGGVEVKKAYLGNALVYDKTGAPPGFVDPNSLGDTLEWWLDFSDNGTMQDAASGPVGDGEQIFRIFNKKTGQTSQFAEMFNPSGSDMAWNAANQQTEVTMGSSSALAIVNGLRTLGVDSEIYVTVKTTRNQVMMVSDSNNNNRTVLIGNQGNSSPPNGNGFGAAVCSVNGVPIAENTRAGLWAEMCTGVPLVAGVQNLNGPNWATNDHYLMAYHFAGFRYEGPITQWVFTNGPLSNEQRTDLVNWMSARLPT